MTDWDRRRLLDIGDAIRRCMNREGLSGEQISALAKVYETANLGTHSVRVDFLAVERVKASLCVACRQGQLYKCDDGACGTETCELYQANNR